MNPLLTVTKQGRRRLQRLARHLEKGDSLGHTKFDFSCYSHGKRKPNGCGTAGCALGECLTLWPRVWRAESVGSWDPRAFRVGIEGYGGPKTSASDFFGIGWDAVLHLFLPNRQSTVFGGKALGLDATAPEVAAGIREFLKVATTV